jgi:hypothetical protein
MHMRAGSLMFLVALHFAAALAAPATAQRVTGVVVDSAGVAVVGAQVRVQSVVGDARHPAVTDSAGAFVLQLGRAGAYEVMVRRAGFAWLRPARVDVGAGEDVELTIRLLADVVELPAVEVRASRPVPFGEAAIYRRIEDMRQRGLGLALTREEIARTGRHSVGSLLTTLSGRVRVVDTQQVTANTILLRGGVGGSYCAPAIFIDGQRANPRPMNVNLLIEPHAVEALELYIGAQQVPPGFEDAAGCGTVLIWSRRGTPHEGRPHSVLRWLAGVGILVGGLLLLR